LDLAVVAFLRREVSLMQLSPRKINRRAYTEQLGLLRTKDENKNVPEVKQALGQCQSIHRCRQDLWIGRVRLVPMLGHT
jgi:hypothetical protein